MSMREKRKVILLIVEGKTEDIALYPPLSKLFEEIDENIELITARIEINGDFVGGDITSKTGVNTSNIEYMIRKLILYPCMAMHRIDEKDVIGVIQIVDTDGAYLDDNRIIEQEGISKTIYNDDAILTDKFDKIADRNERKRDNLDYLNSLTDIKVKNRWVPYDVYYHSCNFDHCTSGERNLDYRLKTEYARDFSGRCYLLEDFIKFYNQEMLAIASNDYDESWEYIREGLHSIERSSNLNVLLNMIKDH